MQKIGKSQYLLLPLDLFSWMKTFMTDLTLFMDSPKCELLVLWLKVKVRLVLQDARLVLYGGRLNAQIESNFQNHRNFFLTIFRIQHYLDSISQGFYNCSQRADGPWRKLLIVCLHTYAEENMGIIAVLHWNYNTST